MLSNGGLFGGTRANQNSSDRTDPELGLLRGDLALCFRSREWLFLRTGCVEHASHLDCKDRRLLIESAMRRVVKPYNVPIRGIDLVKVLLGQRVWGTVVITAGEEADGISTRATTFISSSETELYTKFLEYRHMPVGMLRASRRLYSVAAKSCD